MNRKNTNLFLGGTGRIFATILFFIAVIFIFINEIRDYITYGTNPIRVIMSSILILISIYGVYIEVRRKNENEFYDQTLRLMGKIYYAIYAIDMKKGIYTCIKTTPEIQDKIGIRGKCSQLIETLEAISKVDNDNKFVSEIHLCGKDNFENGPVLRYSREFKRNFNGEYKWANVRIIQDDNIAPGKAIWCFKLVDEEKNNELEYSKTIKDSIASREETYQEKTEFFSKASHDMRTPLNAILGYANLSKNHGEDINCLIDYMGKIESSANQLLLLINDLLEFSKFGEDINRLNIEKFNIEDAIQEVRSSFLNRIKTTNKTIEISTSVEHKTVLGDKYKFMQIIKNILSNSVKYSHSGANIQITINEVAIHQHAKYQITIADNGIGMSKEFLKHIYEPYSREVQGLSDRTTVGTGLGMLLVKYLVQIMNGDIGIDSELGVGTKVVVTLPFDAADDEQIPEIKERVMKETVSEEDENIFFKDMNILVAEDNELNMEILSELLKMRGVNVVKAWNGQEAVDRFNESEVGFFDCVLMDMNMPIMDGCDATRHIRNSGRKDAENVPIFAVTANAYAEDIEKTTAAGMDGHVPKPLDFDLLYKLVRIYIESHNK